MSEKPIMHGRDHRPGGTDPIPNLGIANDWVLADTSLGTVTSGGSPVNGTFGPGSITYQTDGGSVFAVNTSGAVDTIQMLVVGTYLVRARATFPKGRTGWVLVQGVIGGPVTTYDYDTACGSSFFTDISPGEATWEQLCIVNDLSSAAGAYMEFQQTTGSDMVSCTGHLQIFRLT